MDAIAVSVLSRKAKGDLAELKIAADLVQRGHKIAIPYGEDWDYDLILCRGSELERLQAKYVRSNGEYIAVKCFSASLTNGRVRVIKRYTAQTVDWIGVYDITTDRCYYVPSTEFQEGRSTIHLRLTSPRNGQRAGIRLASDYEDLSG